MFNPENFKAGLFSLNTEDFEENALQVFKYQWNYNSVYRSYCDHLHIDPEKVDNVGKIPFLPIEFFKTHQVITGKGKVEKVFMSSGTTGQNRSKHYVNNLEFYYMVAQKAFEAKYGTLKDWEILALLPSYLEQGDSSLIAMIDFFIKNSQGSSRFLLNDYESFVKSIQKKAKCKRLIIGVSYALLDFAEKFNSSCEPATIMETGGMKGRRKEITRIELHEVLKNKFGQDKIHSEYGMTELMSQAYGGDGIFFMPPWCKILIRDVNDPYTYLTKYETGGINVIDLANVNSCAFIETKDLGKSYEDAGFEVLGRFDNTDIRGCNLLI